MFNHPDLFDLCFQAQDFSLIRLQSEQFRHLTITETQPCLPKASLALGACLIPILNRNRCLEYITKNPLTKINKVLQDNDIWFFGIDKERNINYMGTPNDDLDIVFVVVEVDCGFELYRDCDDALA